jgi:hypothetical protein
MLKYLNRFFHQLPLPLRALLPVYLWGMLIFLVFRIALLIASFEQLYEIKKDIRKNTFYVVVISKRLSV